MFCPISNVKTTADHLGLTKIKYLKILNICSKAKCRLSPFELCNYFVSFILTALKRYLDHHEDLTYTLNVKTTAHYWLI